MTTAASLSTATPTADRRCAYTNRSGQCQIVRITDLPDQYFERTVLPGQCLQFLAPATAYLKVYSGNMVTALLDDTIPCNRLIPSG
jgi:Domain of unknown function (DUF1830)